MRLAPASALVLLVACGGSISDPPDDQPPAAQEDRVVRPARVDSITLGLAEHALPMGLRGDATLSVAALSDGTTLLGGRGGLYKLTDAGFEAVDTQAVTALAAYGDDLITVAGAGGLSVYDGSLRASPLDDGLMGASISGLATVGEELWLATDKGLHLFTADALSRFDVVPDADAVATYEGAAEVLVSVPSGFTVLRRAAGGAWELQAMNERSLALAAIAPSGRFFGVESGALFERKMLEAGKNAWRPVALTTGANDGGATGVTALALDPTTGAVWAATGAGLARLGPGAGQVATLATPPSLGAVIALRVTRDGALWASDGVKVVRIGNAGKPIGYGESIARFAADNCLRCHAAVGGVAQPVLEGYEAWVGNIGKIIEVVENRRMPADGMPLRGGDASLLRRWRDDGLRK